MKTKLFSLFDTKAEAFGVPFFMPQRGMAIRALVDLSKDPQSLVYKHPNDFILYELGEFDDLVGEIYPHKTPVNLGIAPKEINQVDSVVENRKPVGQ